MSDLAFEYFEVRPCINLDGGFIVCQTVEVFNDHTERLESAGTKHDVAWTIYGRYVDETGSLSWSAVGYFGTKDRAFHIMRAILAPMVKARDLLADVANGLDLDDKASRRVFLNGVGDVRDDLTDVITKSSNPDWQ